VQGRGVMAVVICAANDYRGGMTKSTYDDLERKIVPYPDSSFRATPEQVQQAKEGFRALDADEQALEARVRAALGADAAGVTVEIDRDQVTLRGAVANAAALTSIPDRVRSVEGVSGVVDQLSVG
jgi:hypothetical protein